MITKKICVATLSIIPLRNFFFFNKLLFLFRELLENIQGLLSKIPQLFKDIAQFFNFQGLFKAHANHGFLTIKINQILSQFKCS